MIRNQTKVFRTEKILLTTKNRLTTYTIAFAICITFSFLMNPFELDVKELPAYLAKRIPDFLWSLLFAAIIAEASLLINKLLIKYLPFTKKSSKRLILQFLFQIAGSVFLTFIFWTIIKEFYPVNLTDNSKANYTLFAQFLASNIIISILLSTFGTVDHLTENWKKTMIEASHANMKALEIQKFALSAELQALKLQIDPHFIFNNLSVLSELILQDQNLAYKYSENFSKVYRYLLINSKKDAISLKEELKFLKSYIYLTNIRVGDGVIFTIEVDDNLIEYFIPPMVLQLLVENALKHNQTASSQPLIIKIFNSDNNYLTVQNTISPLINSADSSGVGLTNLISRLGYIGDRKPIITKTDQHFTAKIPLYEKS